jgi:hypothetical protein
LEVLRTRWGRGFVAVAVPVVVVVVVVVVDVVGFDDARALRDDGVAVALVSPLPPTVRDVDVAVDEDDDEVAIHRWLAVAIRGRSVRWVIETFSVMSDDVVGTMV